MARTQEDVERIYQEFLDEYLKPPYTRYIHGVGRGSHEGELCFHVFVHEEPPKAMNLPDRYKGIKLVYEVSQQAVLHTT